eukprot:g6255.t1
MPDPDPAAPRPPVLFLEGKWHGRGVVYPVAGGGNDNEAGQQAVMPKIHYLEELAVSRQGKAQHYWYHRETWKIDPSDPVGEEKVPLHVESGCIKFLTAGAGGAAGTGAAAPSTAFHDGHEFVPAPAGKDYNMEALFIHPFSLHETSVGFLSSANDRLVLRATEESGSFQRGPGAGGRKTVLYERDYSLVLDEGFTEDACKQGQKLVYRCALQSDAMPQVKPHLFCEMTKLN